MFALDIWTVFRYGQNSRVSGERITAVGEAQRRKAQAKPTVEREKGFGTA